MTKQAPPWPEYLDYAYSALGYEEYKRQVRTFIRRWGGIDLDTFVRVLKEGQGEDRVLAIFALGYTRTPLARELLLPFLQSKEPRERCASALCLGKIREEQALPVLCAMLTEFFPPKEQPGSEADGRWFYNDCRSGAIMILTEWARPEAIPELLKALQAYWDLEQVIIEHSHLATGSGYWRGCQRRVVYALGWLGTFDLLSTMDVGEQRRLAWNVDLALGNMHAHVGIPDVFMNFNEYIGKSRGFHDLVCYVLEEQLGLSEEEQERCLNAYSACYR